MHQKSLPTDTSLGTFASLQDVALQDAASAAHLPIVQAQFDLMSKTVIAGEKVNAKNDEDRAQAIADLREIFDSLLVEDDAFGFLK